LTCIVSYTDNNKMYLACDNYTQMGERVYRKTLPKVYEKGDLLIGGAGNVSNLQAVFYFTDFTRDETKEDDKRDDFHYILFDVVEEMRLALKSRGLIRFEDGVEVYDASFLVGYKGKFYNIGPDFSVMESVEPYDSVGTGKMVALGSLYTTNYFDLPVERKIEFALEAASVHHSDVEPPFEIISKEV